MEQERLARENEEIKEQFSDQDSQWEQDKAYIQDLASQEKTRDVSAAGEAQVKEQVVKVRVIEFTKPREKLISCRTSLHRERHTYRAMIWSYHGLFRPHKILVVFRSTTL
jgi:hypothetical protein